MTLRQVYNHGNLNDRIGWLMIQIERDSDDPYRKQYIEELEARLHDAMGSGCDGGHAFHETACHACYILRRGEEWGKFAGVSIKLPDVVSR